MLELVQIRGISMDKSKIVKNLLGIKYKHKGRSIKDGLDCIGLALIFHPELSKYDIYDYNETYNNEILLKVLENLNKRTGEPQFGDILVFDFYKNKAFHVGIYIENNRFIHVIKSSGVTCPRLNEKYKKALIGVFHV